MFRPDERLRSHLAPGRRPCTSLASTVLTPDGRPVAGLGTPGGGQRVQWTLGPLLRHLRQGLNLQAAIDAPLFHTGHHVSSCAPRVFARRILRIEGRFPDTVRDEPAYRGHPVDLKPAWPPGRMCAAGFTPGRLVRAAATPRFMEAYAVVR